MTRRKRKIKAVRDKRDAVREELDQRNVRIFGVSVSMPVLIRAIGLIVILAMMVGAVYLFYLYFGDLFTAEGVRILLRT